MFEEAKKLIYFRRKSRKATTAKYYFHCEIIQIKDGFAFIALKSWTHKLPLKDILPRTECRCRECILKKGGY